MNLKDYPRPQYAINPILDVVCQLRYPPILKILETPVLFQEKIRNEYPEYQQTGFNFPENFPVELQNMMRSAGMNQGGDDIHHKFASEDNIWQISLGKNYLSLTNIGHYTGFEDFKNRFEKLLEAFHATYSPLLYTRIGLRYKNIITKKIFHEIESYSWSQLIPSHVAPELHDADISEKKIIDFEKKLVLAEGSERINLFNVLTRVSGEFKGVALEDQLAYIIDIDCYTEEKTNDCTTIRDTIISFKKDIQNLFRRSISDELHKALERTSLGEDHSQTR